MRRSFSFVALVLPLIAIPRNGLGQVVSGVVRDSAGVPVAGAVITIPALRQAGETNEKGEYRVANLSPGMRMLTVRRIGYAPFSKLITIAGGDNTLPDIVLMRVAVVLDTVVTEEEMWRLDPLLREMADNMKIGLGHFVLRPALEKLTGAPLEIAFQQRTGLKVVSDGSGHAWIAKSRGVQSMSGGCVELEGVTGSTLPRGAACSPTLCWPKVYLDNQPLSIGRGLVPEINRFLPENTEAIEMYDGGAQSPARYNTLDANCGVIILHSRKFIRKKPA